MFVLTYISNDNHTFVFATKETDKDKAIKKGNTKLKELNYKQYGYKLKEAIKK